MKTNFKDFLFKIYPYIFMFFACAFIGWFLETVVISLQAGALRDRGLPISPICPIYGFGGLFLFTFFRNPKKDIKSVIFNFIKAAIFLGAFELISGLMLKHIFNVEFWNYSNSYLNILNYVTIPSAISWGFLALAFMYFVEPIIVNLSNKTPEKYRADFVISLISIFIIDLSFSILKMIIIPNVFETMVNPFY